MKAVFRALAALSILSISALLMPSSARSQDLTPFTIAVFQSEGYLPDYVVKDKGFGEAHGLDIKFVTPSSGSAAAQLLLAGGVQGWSTDPLIIATAAGRGYDIRIAGVSAPTFVYTILVSQEGDWPDDAASLEERISALKGKRVGVSGIGAGTDNALIMLLNTAGLSADDVTRVAIGQQQAAIGQLAAGRIDAFVSFSLAGNAMIEKEAGARTYIFTQGEDIPESVSDTPHLAFAVSSEFANSNPEAVQGWLDAEREAIAWIRDNPEEASEILNTHLFNGKEDEIAKQIVNQALATFFSKTRDDFKMPPSSFDRVIAEGRAVGAFEGGEPTYEEVVLPSAQMAGELR